ncbi:hypothetical protein BD408DRAFT_78418 [Parasitella parasitica]|nr:hypothetical protein BD408DRAFT_78418 [Parasitella parasitica]
MTGEHQSLWLGTITPPFASIVFTSAALAAFSAADLLKSLVTMGFASPVLMECLYSAVVLFCIVASLVRFGSFFNISSTVVSMLLVNFT